MLPPTKQPTPPPSSQPPSLSTDSSHTINLSRRRGKGEGRERERSTLHSYAIRGFYYALPPSLLPSSFQSPSKPLCVRIYWVPCFSPVSRKDFGLNQIFRDLWDPQELPSSSSSSSPSLHVIKVDLLHGIIFSVLSLFPVEEILSRPSSSLLLSASSSVTARGGRRRWHLILVRFGDHVFFLLLLLLLFFFHAVLARGGRM